MNKRILLVTSLFLFFGIIGNSYAKKKPSLKEAIMTQDIDKMKELLSQGADANEIMTNEPAIAWAVNVGNCDMIKLLVDNGANVNDDRGIFPVIYSLDHAKTPEEMLAENQRLNAVILKRCKGDTVKASQWMKHEDINRFSTAEDKLKLLLELGANPNVYDRSMEDNFFLEQVKKKNISLLKIMLASGKADLELRYHQGAQKILSMVNAINTAGWIDASNPENLKAGFDWAAAPLYNTPLLYAVKQNDLELVKLLVEGGANLQNGVKKEATDDNGATMTHTFYFEGPLDMAIHKEYKEIADYLVSKGALRDNNH